MFSYLHHIGDFNKATRHLSRIERSVYRDLIELYYETETPLQDDIHKLCRLIIATTKEEKAAVNQVLQEFFHLTHRGYVQLRCEHEIEKFSGYINDKSYAGKVSAERRKAKRAEILGKHSTAVEQVLDSSTTGEQQDVNTPSTEGQLTSKPVNQLTSEPIKDITPQAAPQDKPAKNILDYSCWPELATDQILTDWHSMRKRIKANVSQTVINGFGTELHKAHTFGLSVDHCLTECITRNWRGFKMEWLQNSSHGSVPKKPTAGTLNFTSTDYNNGINADGSF